MFKSLTKTVASSVVVTGPVDVRMLRLLDCFLFFMNDVGLDHHVPRCSWVYCKLSFCPGDGSLDTHCFEEYFLDFLARPAHCVKKMCVQSPRCNS